MTLPDPETPQVGKFTFPATPQGGDLAQNAYTQESNNRELEDYVNKLFDALSQDIQTIFEAFNTEHP